MDVSVSRSSNAEDEIDLRRRGFHVSRSLDFFSLLD